ncbi:MAG TPA: OmpH family outer membrane protein [Holophagaceae bacterium]|nr:OmpH family outer membrane protein [Holophagaceae bacterium]
MRRLVPFLLAAAVLPAAAQDAAPKFAVIIQQRLIQQSAHGRKLFSELEILGKNLQDKLAAKQAEGQQVGKQLQSGSIDDAGKEKLQKQLRDLEFEFKKLQEDSQAEFNKAQSRILEQLNKEVGPVIEGLAKERGLTGVFSYQPGMFAYIDEKWVLDFTDEVAKRYDAKYPEAAAPAPAPAAPKPAAKPAGGKK